MLLPVTGLTAALPTLLYVALALRVIALRQSGVGPSVGLGENEHFIRAVRAHGNLGEYAPLFLVLLGLTEASGAPIIIVIGAAVLFGVGRLMHAVGFGIVGTRPWRTLGMIGTNTALLTLAGTIIFFSLST